MSKKEFDIDKEIEKIARKSNFNMRKSEYAFENQIKKLDKDIDKIMNRKIKNFDKNKEMTSKHLSTNYNMDSVERYREKLKKI